MRSRAVVASAVSVLVAGAGAGVLAAAASDSARTAGSEKAFEKAFFGVLRGANEIGTDGKKRAGDLDALGSATGIYDSDTGEFCFGLTVMDTDTPVAAHIHRGVRGRNGDIVITLIPPAGGDPGASNGCFEVEATLMRAIARNPRKYYWNVHTTDFPGGAVRGQVKTKRR